MNDDPLTPRPILGAMTNPALQFPLDLGDGGEIIYCRDEHQRALLRSLYRTWRTSIDAALSDSTRRTESLCTSGLREQL